MATGSFTRGDKREQYSPQIGGFLCLLNLPCNRNSKSIQSMKRYWLDGKRQAPHGWSHFRRGEEFIVELCSLIRAGTDRFIVGEISLGDGFEARWMNANDVLDWMKKVVRNSSWVPPKLSVHSGEKELITTVLRINVEVLNDMVVKRDSVIGT